MVRFSVTLDEEQNRWVERRAEELNGSKTQVVGMLIDAAREGRLDPFGPPETAGAPTTTGELLEELRALGERVDDLETAREDRGTAPASPPGDADRSGADRCRAEATDSERDDVVVADTGGGQRFAGRSSERDGPDAAAVEEFLARETGDVASAEEVLACWELLRKRGTASPRAFKQQCGPAPVRAEEELAAWWEEGVRPLLVELPGVEPPEEHARFFRYRY